MNALSLVLGLQLRGVVDRVEGDFAVVEWRDGSFADLPLALVPGAAEGLEIRLHLRPSRDRNRLTFAVGHTEIATPLGPLALPRRGRLRPGAPYAIRTSVHHRRPPATPKPERSTP